MDEEERLAIEEEKARERAEAERLVGRILGDKYRIDAFVGGGAMGKVYRATQLLLDKTVAVKVLHAGLGQDEKFQGRFHREAKAASKLDHPNSVAVTDFGIDRDGTMFIVMEFLAGRDLFAAMRKEWPLSNERIVEIMSQVLSALAVAHEQGIVHRDLKPENIMLVPKKQDEGHLADVVKVADFGIAKILDAGRGADGERLSTQGTIAGTPEYMSPEQAQARSVDGRADLYSCGVILYEMCTGKLPFTAETTIGVVLKHITEMPALPSTINPAIPPEMEAVIMKALAKSPDARFDNARAMRSALRAVVGARETTSTSLSASALSAIAAIDGHEMASTLVGVAAPQTVTGVRGASGVEPPSRDEGRANTIASAPSMSTPVVGAPAGPSGTRTHSTSTSHEVPLVPSAKPERGVSKGVLAASIAAALSVGAIAVVSVKRNDGRAQTNAMTAPVPASNDSVSNHLAHESSPTPAPAPAPAPAPGPAPAPAPAPVAQPIATPTPLVEPAVVPSPAPSAEPSALRPARTSRTTAISPANSQSIQAQPAATPTPAVVPSPAVVPAPVATPTPAVQPTPAVVAPEVRATQPPPLAALSAVRASAGELRASGGVLVNRLQGRAQTAADALGRCALQQARAQRAEGSFTSAIDVTLNIAVAERRLDRLRLLGAPGWLQSCAHHAEPAFAGDLPESDDPEYTITLRVSLAPQR
jgi:serine/threonine-protein kinase